MKIGIIGNGFVGNATKQLECEDIEILAYDINPELCYPKNITLLNLLDCEAIFVSVPTPMKKNGKCHLDIVLNVVEQLNNINYEGFIVIRSTVPVGTCDSLSVYFMPEFLTEKNYINDFNVLDKAGSYNIEDAEKYFIKNIDGCYNNIVGFPEQKFLKSEMKRILDKNDFLQ